MPPRVYVVDDDSLVTQSLGTALRLETDWDVVACNDASEALAMMADAPPDVVISDLKMPRLDGIAFLKRVRALPSDAVLLLLTGYADKESAIQAINDVGIWQYVEKPWQWGELMLKVRQGMERRDLVGQLSVANHDLAAQLRELTATREQLLVAERLAAVGRVMAGLTHEIGNQLGLMGYAQLIIDRTTDPEVAGFARTILRTQQRLGSMLEEIKDYSRGAGVYAREPADVAEMAREAIGLLEFDRDVKGRIVTLEPAAHPRALVHRGKLLQVIINLVRNAAQASDVGGEVLVHVDEDGAGGALLRIVDRGAGMPEAVVARLGEPFFTTRETGTGLGVGITRRIVEEHGGSIRFASTPGQGTEVQVRLPPIPAGAVGAVGSGGSARADA